MHLARGAPLLTLLLLVGCNAGGLDVTLRLSDPVFAATSSARLIISSSDGAVFPARGGEREATGLNVSNFDADGDGTVDVVLDLLPQFAFLKRNRFAIRGTGVARAVNVTVRAEVYDLYGNRLA